MADQTEPRRYRHNARRVAWVILTGSFLGACGGSGGDNPRTMNTLPSIQLNDGDVLSNGSSIVSIAATDDTGIASVNANLLRQGRLQECESEFDLSLARDSLFEACLADQPTCTVEFIPSSNAVEVYPPPLFAPIGQEYALSFVDRDGESTDPVNAVFCFDVGINTPPMPAADTFQLVFPSTIQRNGVVYDSRCEKQPGSGGVLANDDDDEHVTNTCLTAELVDLPRFATNLSTFRNTFRSDGGFRYEGLTNAAADSFTYRVSDGVNPPSDPIRVDIVFSGENSPPVAVDDEITIAEDSIVQAINVLSNDTDPDALPLSVSEVNNGPTAGIATIRNGVVIEYQPNADFNGTDSFDYVVIDSAGVADVATVRIQVTPVNDGPEAVNDESTTAENTPVTINVLGNDSDPEGDTITVADVSAPTNGTVQINSENQLIYTPGLNFAGSDAFEYTIEDSAGARDTATVRVDVVLVNVGPQPVDDFASTPEGETVDVRVLDNDIDEDGDELSLIEVSAPENGVAVIRGSRVRYTPNDGFNGTDTFTYTVSDGIVSSSANLTISVDSVNAAPVAVDDVIDTPENTSVLIAVLGNDSDPDGDALAVADVVQPQNGVAAIEGDSIRYTPNEDFEGSDSFVYTLSDGTASDTASVTVTIDSVNDRPVAEDDDDVTTSENTPVQIAVLDNDFDPDGDELTIEIIRQPGNGEATVVNGGILYTPDEGFFGNDGLAYRVTDPGGLSDPASVDITVTDVNAAPVANNDAVSTPEDTPVTIEVLSNDTDDQSAALSLDEVGAANDGSVAIAGNSAVYTPDEGFVGTDSFTYSVSDARGLSASATVTVTVTNVNVAPQAADDSVTTEENTAVTLNVAANDSDADGDALTIVAVGSPDNGTAEFSGNEVTYTPDDGFSDIDSFSYTIEDPGGLSDTAIVTVTVNSVNAAPVAVSDEADTTEDTAISINVLRNDSDEDGDDLTITSVGSPGNGSAAIVANAVDYTPESGFSGTDSFGYTVSDDDGLTDTTTVTVTVSEVNVAPQAEDDIETTVEGEPVAINVLANDTDEDGDNLTVSAVGLPGDGTAEILDNAVRYTPDDGFSGTDSFNYTVADEGGLTDTGSVTVTVTEVNTPPQAVDDTATTLASTPVTIDVLLNDSDEDGDSLLISAVGTPDSGVAVLLDNAVEYTSKDGYSGTDTFTYTVSDEGGLTNSASVTVTVTEPVAEPSLEV